jgi:formylglycine-generating enzyme required for sulfatase activity
MAYCAWLQAQARAPGSAVELLTGVAGAPPAWHDTGEYEWTVRLPSEAEWEWAAGSARHATYAWASGWNEDRANTLEGRVMSTSPVGAYPQGKSDCGALDLCGNVWEWTLSLYQPYPYQPDDGREDPSAEGRRVLRGGSWGYTRRFARVSSRNRYGAAAVNFLVGFRVVVAPVLS